jgi:hypothetical protein
MSALEAPPSSCGDFPCTLLCMKAFIKRLPEDMSECIWVARSSACGEVVGWVSRVEVVYLEWARFVARLGAYLPICTLMVF